MNLLLAEFLFFAGVLSDRTITCYGFGGLQYPNNTRCPGSNACCGVEATCLSNRLCHKPNDGPNTYVRGPCAVDPYDSGTCAQICLYKETTGVLPRVRACSDGSLCCDSDDDHCCDDGNGIFVDAEGKISDQAPSVIHSYGPERTASTFRMSTATPSTSSSESPTPSTLDAVTTASPESSHEADGGGEDDHLGVKIGVGIGIPVAVLVISGACVWFWWKNRKTGSQKPDEADAYTANTMGYVHGDAGDSTGVKYELPGRQQPVELESNYYR